jgi:hypothetical protein
MVVLDNSFNGAITTTVNGGTLQVGDAASTFATLSSTSVDVVGGILSGHGTVNADVSVEPGGTLMPGGSIGTLTINGNLVFNNGSYLVELNPAAHSFTQVNGSATFNGGTVLLKPTLGFYGAQTYSIMNATSGLTATPNPPPLGFANSASINGVALSTTPSDLILTFAANSASTLVTPAGATTNQQNVANGLNTFILAAARRRRASRTSPTSAVQRCKARSTSSPARPAGSSRRAPSPRARSSSTPSSTRTSRDTPAGPCPMHRSPRRSCRAPATHSRRSATRRRPLPIGGTASGAPPMAAPVRSTAIRS